MVDIPSNETTDKDLEVWYKLQDELKALKAKEMLLRTKIFKSYFKAPVEGTNVAELGDGYVLKATYPLSRDIDVGALTAITKDLETAGIFHAQLVQWKPSLKLAEYRTLTEEQLALFDQCLIIKPGAPSLKIELPAKRK